MGNRLVEAHRGQARPEEANGQTFCLLPARAQVLSLIPALRFVSESGFDSFQEILGLIELLYPVVCI
jgi:hypothetical protein